MFTGNQANLTVLRRHALLSKTAQVVVFPFMLILLGWVPAFGQMGSSVTYSDSWADYSGNPGYIIGCGITSDSYNTYGHRYWVSSTIRSPSGRTASGTSFTSSSYARIDVSLSWDYESDFGDFTTTSTHSMTCPYVFGFTPTTTTTTGVRAGASSVVFGNSGLRDSQNRCIMNIINPCNVICTGRGQTNEVQCRNYVIYIEPWIRWGSGSYVCLGFFSSWVEKSFYSDSWQPCMEH